MRTSQLSLNGTILLFDIYRHSCQRGLLRHRCSTVHVCESAYVRYSDLKIPSSDFTSNVNKPNDCEKLINLSHDETIQLEPVQPPFVEKQRGGGRRRHHPFIRLLFLETHSIHGEHTLSLNLTNQETIVLNKLL